MNGTPSRQSGRSRRHYHRSETWYVKTLDLISSPDAGLESRTPWRRLVLVLAARPAYALLAQEATAGVAWLLKRDRPSREAASWWMVYGTLTDLGCLAVLSWAVRAEGQRLRDLLPRPQRAQLGGETLRSLGVLLVLAPSVALSSAVTRRFYGPALPPQVEVVREASASGRLPPWAAIYGAVLWPALWAVTEELVYLGYLLPRLEVRIGTRAAATMVAVVWAGQHVVIPLLPDTRYLVSRANTALPITATLTAYYVLSGRRQLPPILAHWASDASTGFLAGVLPILQRRSVSR